MSATAERLKQAMDLRGMKQAEIVEKTGINKGALSSYLKGRYKPKQYNVYLLAKVLNVSEAWLMGADVPMDRDLGINGDGKGEDDPLEIRIRELLASMTREEKLELLNYIQFVLSKRPKS